MNITLKNSQKNASKPWWNILMNKKITLRTTVWNPSIRFYKEKDWLKIPNCRMFLVPHHLKIILFQNDYLLSRNLNNTLPKWAQLVGIFFTILATRSSAERSFQHWSISDHMLEYDCLSSLGLMSIEKELFRELKKLPTFYNSLIDIIAAENNRRINLKYK